MPLSELERLHGTFGREAAARKLELLRRLRRARLGTADEVARLHEQLCFIRAYPDDPVLLTLVEQMLEEFAERRDLARHRDELSSRGIAGTDMCFRFYWITAAWIVRKWPERLSIDWHALGDGDDALLDVLPLLRTYSDSAAMLEVQLSAREWIEHLKPPDQTDATFLVRRIQSLRCSEAQRCHLFESLRLPMRLAVRDRPSRTLAKDRTARPAYQSEAWVTGRPDLPVAIRAEPLGVRSVSAARGRAYIHLAREAMVARNRDLDAIAWADPDDVQVVDWGGGLQFVWLGIRPRHRPLLEGLYVYLTLQNGVPIGYVQAAALFESAFINYNVFEPWRGGEAAMIYGKALATAHHMLGVETFAIDVYQLGGDGNQEALRSGAWWFYYKLGFRPRTARVRKVLRRELRRMRRRPKHRSSIQTLEELAADEMFFHLDGARDDIVGVIDFGTVGLRVMDYLTQRFGSDREHGLEVCSEEARRRLGLRRTQLTGLDPSRRVAWQRWAPLVLLLPGVDRWARADKRALFDVVCAKGGPRESDFVRRFDAHRELRRSFLRLSEGG